MQDIKIGTLIGPSDAKEKLKKLVDLGFESFSMTFWEKVGDNDLEAIAKDVVKTLEGTDCVVSSLSVFGNPLVDNDRGAQARESWERCIDAAGKFGADLVTGFAGRIVDRPVNESIEAFAKVFSRLAKRAADKNVRLAFENCEMGGEWNKGDWNIAYSSKAWELMFEAVPDTNVGLQWEPCHQMVQLVDPIPQLRKWVKKVFCLHGKDATVAWDIIRERGINCGEPYVWHRTPGFGDTNWSDIVTILRMNGFKGSIDIEGFHDPVYRGALEYTGQVRGLKYLKECRGGDFIPNP
ncbi:MAG: sugar phosphate isomerase/epimerase [Defluviitaleaceae bacterium]|nr:sugar phosphate isomerase/epimerase [Defluviitaleaceae bacterium]